MMPLPTQPGIAVSVDYFRSRLVMPRGKHTPCLVTCCFSRPADISSVTAVSFIAEGAAIVVAERYVTPGGLPCRILFDNGFQFHSKHSHVVHQLLGDRKNCHPLLPLRRQRRDRTCTPRNGSDSGDGPKTSFKTTKMSSPLAANLRTTGPSAPPLVWRTTRSL